MSVAFLSDGSRIVSGSYDRTIHIWDTASDTIQYSLDGHTGQVNTVAFSSDGSHIVSGSYDRTVRIWDANTGVIQHVLDNYNHFKTLQQCLATSVLHKGMFTSSILHPNG
jgi:WD40 repeat protein